MSGEKNPRVVRAAGKPTFVAKTLAGQPTMHETHGEFQLGKLAGNQQASGERPAMDRNRRP